MSSHSAKLSSLCVSLEQQKQQQRLFISFRLVQSPTEFSFTDNRTVNHFKIELLEFPLSLVKKLRVDVRNANYLAKQLSFPLLLAEPPPAHGDCAVCLVSGRITIKRDSHLVRIPTKFRCQSGTLRVEMRDTMTFPVCSSTQLFQYVACLLPVAGR